MAKIKLKVKKPNKAKVLREIRRAMTKNLKCPNCGRNMPTTSMSTSRCSGCGFIFKMT